MTKTPITGLASTSVGWRLMAGLAPSLVAVALVAGLFYYGQYERQVPAIVLAAAALLTAASLIATWANARYIATRIARLTRVAGTAAAPGDRADAFDQIERVVDHLGSALSASEADRARADAELAAQRRDEATMLSGVVSDTLAQLDEIRLPLHILLENRFGELNENQEELLRDARAAADTIDTALRRLGQLADADRGALPVQHELVQINDVVRAVLPLARAAAERHGGRLDVALEPGLPRVFADRTRLAEALSLLTTDVASAVSAAQPMSISTGRDGAAAVIRVAPRPNGTADVKRSSILAERLVAAQGGNVTSDAGATVLRLG